MSKGIRIVDKPVYEKAVDKNYYIKGFELVTLDETGAPYFKLDEYDKTLKTTVKFITDKPDEETPAMRVNPAEYVALVHLLGGTDFQPTYENRTLAQVMLEGRDKANAAGKMFVAESKNGWVNTYDIPQLHPPEGLYKVRFKDAFSPDHQNYDFTVRGDNGGFIIFRFEIADQTMWEGFVISIFMNNTWVDQLEDGGEVLNAVDEGMPLSRQGFTLDRWVALGEYFAPGLWETHEWQVSPAKSPFGVCEVKNPQYVLIHAMLAQKREVNVYYEKRERNDNFWFDPKALKKTNVKPTTTRTGTIAEFVAYVKAKEWRYTNAAGEEEMYTDIFTSEEPLEFALNDEGESAWAKEFLVGPWQAAGLDLKDKNFGALSPTQLGMLMTHMEKHYGK